jgi:hypothetical protein
MRKHEGCGTNNPFNGLYLWASLGVGWVLAIGLLVLTRSFWSQLAWLVTLAMWLPVFRWEIIHAPSKMYKTWWP